MIWYKREWFNLRNNKIEFKIVGWGKIILWLEII